MAVNPDEMYEAIAHAETGSFKNPHIRTVANKTPGGSTAFGRVQITGTLAEGASKNKYLSQESEKYYREKMKPRYDAMKKHGNMKGKLKDYDADYDYGGSAKFDASEEPEYEKFAKDVISGVAKEAKDDEGAFIKKWRGNSGDKEYFKRFQEGKKRYKENSGQEMARQYRAMTGLDQGRPNTEEESRLD